MVPGDHTEFLLPRSCKTVRAKIVKNRKAVEMLLGGVTDVRQKLKCQTNKKMIENVMREGRRKKLKNIYL